MNPTPEHQKSESNLGHGQFESTTEGQGGSPQWADNRPEAIAQRKLQSAANNSPQVQQMKTLQAKVNSKEEGPQSKQRNPVQAKVASSNGGVVQRMPDPRDKQAAEAQHLLDQQRVYNLIEQAANADVPSTGKPTRAKLLKNTAELIKGGFATLIVMSRTHADPAFRTDTEVGYFDLTVPYPRTGGSYNDGVDDHVYMAPKSIAGHADHRGEIRIYDPADISDENLKTVLIHEMQHQVDFHNPGEAFNQPAVGGVDNAQAVNGYQSEFRAYWLGGLFKPNHLGAQMDRLGFGAFDALNDRRVPSGSLLSRNFETRFQNQRQEKIFWHMVDSGSYEYVLTAYQQSQAFRDMVHNFTLPVGGNLLNSIRIDNLRRRILTLSAKIERENDHIRTQTVPPTVPERARALELQTGVQVATSQMDTVVNQLEAQDTDFLLDQTRSGPFWAFAQDKIGGIKAQTLQESVRDRKRALILAGHGQQL